MALGTGLGLVILGVGGRLAMRIIGLASRAPAIASAEGTLTVLASGAAAGAGGALVYWLLAWRIPGKRLRRAFIFAVFLCLITMRGLDPVTPIAAILFSPLVALYGVAFELLWHRRQSSDGARTEGRPATL